MNQVNRQTVFRNSRQSLKPKLRSLHRQFKRTSTPGFFEPISLFCRIFKKSVLQSSYLNKAFCLRKKILLFQTSNFRHNLFQLW